MKRGIVLVANLKSQQICTNLIYSIRESGCQLPIRLIHFGGEKINSQYILEQVEFLTIDDFSQEAKHFVSNLKSVLTDCPTGFLYRFLAWFSDWDQFIYSDNDIVALMNWERLFAYTDGYDLVHADEEYTTAGIYNYLQPKQIETIFGEGTLSGALTAGHIVVNANKKMIADINSAVDWFKKYPEIPKKHDQSLLHVASLLGKWKLLNLCKSPHNWLSSWSGDYKNSLDLILAMQGSYKQQTVSHKKWCDSMTDDVKSYKQRDVIHHKEVFNAPISHLHYSGRGLLGQEPIDDLLFSSSSNSERMKVFFNIQLSDVFFISHVKTLKKRIFGHLKRRFKDQNQYK
jgi:hypothetical protein